MEADEFDELEGDNDSLIDYFASDVYSASLVALEMYVYAQTGTYTKVRLQHNTNNIFSREGRGGMVDAARMTIRESTPQADALPNHALLLLSCLDATPSNRPDAKTVVQALSA